jgi:BirA family biotin operon repressor/biotin-[acetyl-CoA-carboxylase] ligase
MVSFTDSIGFAERVTGVAASRWSAPSPTLVSEVLRLSESIYGGAAFHESTFEIGPLWNYLFLVEAASHSHFDRLVELGRRGSVLPSGILCLAGSGKQFHGFNGRPWSAPPGNIYLAVYLAPHQPIDHAGTAFTVLAAVSVLDAIDDVPALHGRAGIKWVNDVLIDNAKVAGVLAYTQSEGDAITGVVLGIGLNVETTPLVESTPFVPRVGSLREFVPEAERCDQHMVFQRLIIALESNYSTLVGGDYAVLLDRYRQRSVAVDRHVTLCSEASAGDEGVVARGRVIGLSDDLALEIEGHDKPFSKGRLILDPGLRSQSELGRQ